MKCLDKDENIWSKVLLSLINNEFKIYENVFEKNL